MCTKRLVKKLRIKQDDSVKYEKKRNVMDISKIVPERIKHKWVDECVFCEFYLEDRN